MKSTGLIRRTDDLGRVVIPREIRRTLNIQDGDPLEIFVTDNMVCYKKYGEENLLNILERFKDILYLMNFDLVTITKIERHIKEMTKIIKETQKGNGI